MVTMSSVEEILACLNRLKTRATYGAVGAVLGTPAQSVGQYLGLRRPEASWVVLSKTKLPSGYSNHQLHPKLTSAPLVRTGEELRKLLKQCRGPG